MSAIIRVPYIEYGEFCLNLVAPAFNIYFIYLLKRPFFHLNLRILLVNFSIGLIVLTLSRNLILIHSVTRFLSVDAVRVTVHYIHNVGLYAVMDAGFLIAGERLVATCIADKYEKVRKCWIAVALCLLMWAMNGFLAFNTVKMVLVTYLSSEPTLIRFYVPLAFVYSSVMIMNSVGFGTFLAIYRYNRKCWEQDLQKKLSHRYQVMENVRTARQLLVALLFDFLISVYLFAVLFYRISTPATDVALNYLSQMVDLICAVTAIMMPCLFIGSHPRLKYVAKKQLCRGKSKKIVKIPNKSVLVLSSRRVAVEETNIYFSQLRNSWELTIRK